MCTLASKKWYLVGRKLIGISILIVWLGLVLWLVTPAATLGSLEKVDDYPLYTMCRTSIHRGIKC
jgi:hypothetical protein